MAAVAGRMGSLYRIAVARPATAIVPMTFAGIGRKAAAQTLARSLRDVRSEDLADVGRLLHLHEQAVQADMAKSSEPSPLAFVTSAVHTTMIGRSNPAGLFAETVRRGWWKFATFGAEDKARRMLREHDRGMVTMGSTIASITHSHKPLGGPVPEISRSRKPTWPAMTGPARRSTFVPNLDPDEANRARILAQLAGKSRQRHDDRLAR